MVAAISGNIMVSPSPMIALGDFMKALSGAGSGSVPSSHVVHRHADAPLSRGPSPRTSASSSVHTTSCRPVHEAARPRSRLIGWPAAGATSRNGKANLIPFLGAAYEGGKFGVETRGGLEERRTCRLRTQRPE